MADNPQAMNDPAAFFSRVSEEVNRSLDALVPPGDTEPIRLHEAIRWSLFAGGKRLRPALVIAAGRAFGASDSELIHTASAVEMIHTYSLIHDDLPAMDDDDLRRGRETCHKKFDEATAILAGDALQALAFQAIASDITLSEKLRLKLIAELADAAACMVAGQQQDLEAEGQRISIDRIQVIHQNKTGELIRMAARAGAAIGKASEAEIEMVSEFGRKVGLLFQITDDILDVTQTTEALGKTAAKDLAAEKATYPAYYGVEKTLSLAAQIHGEAIGIIAGLGRPALELRSVADLILDRQS